MRQGGGQSGRPDDGGWPEAADEIDSDALAAVAAAAAAALHAADNDDDYDDGCAAALHPRIQLLAGASCRPA